jgi:chaperone modulatory protein CbpM
MNVQDITVIEIVDETRTLGIVELAACACIEQARVVEMVEAGLLEPSGEAIEQWRFLSRDMRRLRAAERLVGDLGVNLAGAALILDLIEERDTLARRLQQLEGLLADV